MSKVEDKTGTEVDTSKTGVVDSTSQSGGDKTKEGSQSNDPGSDYLKAEAKKAFEERDAAKKELAAIKAKQDEDQKAQLTKNQEFEKLWKSEEEKRKAVEAELERERETAKKWSTHLTKQVEESKKSLTAEQVATIQSFTSDPEKQLELITKLFPSKDGKPGESRPSTKNGMGHEAFMKLSPTERAQFLADGGVLAV